MLLIFTTRAHEITLYNGNDHSVSVGWTHHIILIRWHIRDLWLNRQILGGQRDAFQLSDWCVALQLRRADFK